MIGFYQMVLSLQEMNQGLMDKLIDKFKQESPNLGDTVIKYYINRFKQLQNTPHIKEKDIFKYTWKDLENIVDSYPNRGNNFKTGTFDPNAEDKNLIYRENGIRIYHGMTKEDCIKYGQGYSFCISARGEGNMYSQYRMHQEGTIYFVFNDNLPKEDKNHVLVIIANNIGKADLYYGGVDRYTVTTADNRGDVGYRKFKDIVAQYPWTKPLGRIFAHEGKHIPMVDSERNYILAKNQVEHNFNQFIRTSKGDNLILFSTLQEIPALIADEKKMISMEFGLSKGKPIGRYKQDFGILQDKRLIDAIEEQQGQPWISTFIIKSNQNVYIEMAKIFLETFLAEEPQELVQHVAKILETSPEKINIAYEDATDLIKKFYFEHTTKMDYFINELNKIENRYQMSKQLSVLGSNQ